MDQVRVTMKQFNIQRLLIAGFTFLIVSSLCASGHSLVLKNGILNKIEVDSCQWPAEVFLIADKEEGVKHGDFITVEARGYSVNGGIPPFHDVSIEFNFFWEGEIEYLDERFVKIKLDSTLGENTLEVLFTLTVDGNSCYDTASITFEFEDDITDLEEEIICHYPPTVYLEQDVEGPFCDGDRVTIEAFGYSEEGPIPPQYHDVFYHYYFNWEGEVEPIDYKSATITLDREIGTKIEVVFGLQVDDVICYDTVFAEFDFKQMINSELIDVKWSPGDSLTVFSDMTNLCYQWGKIVDNVEVELEGENESFILAGTEENSIFVSSIQNERAIPYDSFEEIYFVQVLACDGNSTHCKLKKYFIPENFQSIDLKTLKTNDEGLKIFPNPGAGRIIIEDQNLKGITTDVQLDVISIDGGLHLQKESIFINNYTNLDLRALPSGVYNIRITFPDSRVENVLYSKFLD